MLLKVNGEDKEFDAVATVGELLALLGVQRERVAVMLNEDVLKRAELDGAKLSDGDIIEIITMVGGG